MHAYKKKIKGDISSGIRIAGVSSTFGNLLSAGVVLKNRLFLSRRCAVYASDTPATNSEISTQRSHSRQDK